MKFALVTSGVLILCFLMALGVLPWPPLWPLILAATCAAFLLTGARSNADMLHPIRVLGSLWTFCLALASVRLLSFISRWPFWMWVAVLTGLLSFIGGFLCLEFFYRRKGPWGPPLGRFRLKPVCLPGGFTLKIAIICIFIGTAVLVYEDSIIGSVPILASNPDAVRQMLFPPTGHSSLATLSVRLIHPLVEFVKYGVFLAAIVLFQSDRTRKGLRLPCIGMIVLGSLVYVSQGGRGFVVQLAVVITVLFHYLRCRIRFKHVAVVGLVGFLFVGLYGAYRINQSHSAPLFERALRVSRFPQGEAWQGVAFGYATATISFEVFYQLTQDFRFYTKPPHGFLLYAFHRLVPRANIQQFAAGLFTGQAITPTFLGEFYGDYGYLGVLIGPLILGLAYGWVYRRMKTTRSVYPIFVQALLIEMLIFFPYVDLFSQYLTWIFDLFFMYFLIRWAERRVVLAPSGVLGGRSMHAESTRLGTFPAPADRKGHAGMEHDEND